VYLGAMPTTRDGIYTAIFEKKSDLYELYANIPSLSKPIHSSKGEERLSSLHLYFFFVTAIVVTSDKVVIPMTIPKLKIPA
jgi:hypothetical protein